MRSIGLPVAPIHRRVTNMAIWVIPVCVIILCRFRRSFDFYLVRVVAVVSWRWSDTGLGYFHFCRLLGFASGFVGIVTKQRSQCVRTQWRDQESAERFVRGTHRSAKRSSSRSSGSVIAVQVTQIGGKHERKKELQLTGAPVASPEAVL